MTLTQQVLHAAQPGALTLRELALRTGLGVARTRGTVRELRRRGALHIVGTRRVPYRNRPVAEYAPAAAPAPRRCELSAVLAGWAVLA